MINIMNYEIKEYNCETFENSISYKILNKIYSIFIDLEQKKIIFPSYVY